MTKYIAFLRGINVGGKIVPMKTLAEVFASLGYRDITTILASGNVVFSAKKNTPEKFVTEIEAAIKKQFGFEVFVQVRPLADIQKMVVENPFAHLQPDGNTHWYVTFLNEPVENLPAIRSDFFAFVALHDNAIFSTLERQKGKSTDFMTFLDKQFGKKVTTRNWRTVEKISQVGSL